MDGSLKVILQTWRVSYCVSGRASFCGQPFYE